MKSTDEKEQGMHRKRGRRDVVSTSENPDTRISSEDDSRISRECNNDDDTESNTLVLDSADDTNNKDYEDKDDDDDECNSDYSDAEENNGGTLHSEKQAATNVEMPVGGCSKRQDRNRSHSGNENRKVGAKSRLRQRPVLNSALDPVAVPDSDDEN